MKISNFNPTPNAKLPGQTQVAQDAPEGNEPPKESYSPGNSEFKNNAIITGCGFVPLLGAATNLMAGWATAWHDGDAGKNSGRPTVALGGALANLAGTAIGTYGLFSGSQTARMTGMALIGVSGLAAGAVCMMTDRR